MAAPLLSAKQATSFRRIAGSPVMRLAFLGLIAIVTLSMFFVHRTFLVEAETSYAELTFASDVTTWTLNGATICTPRETPDLGALGGGACPPMLYAPYVPPDRRENPPPAPGAQPEFVSLTWGCGVRVSLQADTDGALVITVLGFRQVAALPDPCRDDGADDRAYAQGQDFGADTIIVIGAEDWRENGALPFQAEVTLGEDIGPGAIHYLQSGRWEARQTSRILEFLGVHSVTEVVKEGEFSIGAEATIFDGRHRAVMFGQITPVGVDLPNSLPGFDVVMLSSPGNTELRLAHFGFEDAVAIRPDWVDTAINSPVFLALFTILSFLAVVFQIVGDWPFRTDEDEKEPGD